MDVEVAVVVPVGAVGAAEDAFDLLILGDVVFEPCTGVGVVAEDGDDGVAFVEDDESAM